MTVTTRAVRYQALATNDTQDLTVTGFGTPTAAIFIYSYGTSDETDTDNFLIGHGFYDGTNDACVYGHSQDGYTTTGTAAGTYRVQNAVRDDAAVYYYDRNATTARSATAAFIDDGVRLTWAGTTSMRPYVTAILIKGA